MAAHMGPPHMGHPPKTPIHKGPQNNTTRPPNPKKAAANPTTKPAANSWADNVRVTDSSTRFSLDKLPRQPHGSRLQITKDVLSESSEQWTRCLVGFFPGSRLPYHVVSSIASRVWQKHGLVQTMTTEKGFYLFQFHDEEDVHKILDRGPWMFGGKNIILQQWHPHIQFDKNKISSLPVWIRLTGLPFPLWNRTGLSLAASMVGRPLSCDEHTFSCKRLDFARLCVEVDAAHPFVHSFEMDTPLSKDPIKVEVSYEWKPSRCNECKVYGHSCRPQTPLEPTSDGHTDKPKEQEPIPTLVEQHPSLSTIQPQANPTCPPLATSQTLPQKNPNTQVLKKDKMVVIPHEEPRSTTEASSSGVKQALAAAPQGALASMEHKLDSSQSQNSGDPSSESQEFVADSATTTDNDGKHASTKHDHQQDNSPTLSQKAVKKKKGARKRKEAMGL
ncbi:hypothetical protein DKX38_023269 [Salix brachista]|uniref:DUF4283 domain-containing protein n=1 Tax=Salix brachista TaxID=2182728 RepID=A0A5N5JN86_9ROSI|nr:hypothetical protein DKX38_023269 [Salix brachista]